jgi:hypothetical protein
MSGEPASKQPILNALLASGFPFQTAIAEVVKSVAGFDVARQEFPWRDHTGTDRFLDLVVCCQHLIVTIECKKTQKETFTFLHPTVAGKTPQQLIRARCVYLQQVRDSSRRLVLWSGDLAVKPASLQSAFCVVGTSDSGKDQRLLERDAQLLIRGTDAYGRYEASHANRSPLDEPNRVIIPVIVTNAKLFSISYDPNSISLETGQLPMMPEPDIAQIEWVRFRKAFTTSIRDVGDRTIFVVAAASFQKFLNDLNEFPHPVLARNEVAVPD